MGLEGLVRMNHLPDWTHCMCLLPSGEQKDILRVGFYFGSRTSLKWFLLMIYCQRSPQGSKFKTSQLRFLPSLLGNLYGLGTLSENGFNKSHGGCWKHLLKSFSDKNDLCCAARDTPFSLCPLVFHWHRQGLSQGAAALPLDAALAFLPGACLGLSAFMSHTGCTSSTASWWRTRTWPSVVSEVGEDSWSLMHT